jgi:hypothetical protein
MNEFIKQNKRLLRFYYITAQILGWLLLAGGFVWFMAFVSVSGYSPRMDRVENILYIASSYTFDFVLLGALTIGMAQFIRYLFEAEYRGGRILRVLDKIFYLYALCLVISAAVGYFWYIRVAEQSSIDRLLFAQPLVLPLVAKVLILVGLGQILKRIIPVIEESKTLV